MSYQRHEALTHAEAANAARRESGEAKQTGGLRPAFEGTKLWIPMVANSERWYHW